MHLDFLLEFFHVGCAVAESRGDEEVDDFAGSDAGVGVVDCAEYSGSGGSVFGIGSGRAAPEPGRKGQGEVCR